VTWAEADWITRVAVDGRGYTRLVLDGDDLAIVEFYAHSTTGGAGDQPQDQSRYGRRYNRLF
jgi:hypothetical protein